MKTAKCKITKTGGFFCEKNTLQKYKFKNDFKQTNYFVLYLISKDFNK